MRTAPWIIALAVALVPAAVGAGSPIKNLVDVPISLKADGTSFTDQEVRTAIIEGCIAKRWSPTVNDDGTIRAAILVRQTHFAEVEISYGKTAYSITYVSSRELNYNDRRQSIHKNYNKWVVNLSASINKSLGERLSGATPTADPDADDGQKDIYSELIKLDDLRQKGIITDDEFEEQKRKLLKSN